MFQGPQAWTRLRVRTHNQILIISECCIDDLINIKLSTKKLRLDTPILTSLVE